MLRLTFLVATGAAIVAAMPASGAVISGLYNTGVDDAGVTLLNGAAEQHYTLATGVYGLRVATSANGFPIGPWLGDDSASAWVGPNSDSSLDGYVGAYDYRLTFSLAGMNAATASIIGQWSTDDSGVDILINGVSTGQTAGGFSNWYGFNVNSGFISGINTIDFVLNNGGGPTGFRVEMSGTADAATAAPEPSSWAMMLCGFGAIGAGLRNRRKLAISFA